MGSGGVDWARVSRMRFERDMLLVPVSGADRSAPMEAGGLVTKVGLDATVKEGDRQEGSRRAMPNEAARQGGRLNGVAGRRARMRPRRRATR